MGATDPVIVIGAGLAGAASAWALARRDVPVVLLEQFAVGHRHGSSHGSARIVRRAYADALYVRLTGRAFELWDEVQTGTDDPLIRYLGALDFGPGRYVDRIAGLLADAGVAHEVLAPDAAAERWPGMRFADEVLFHLQAGTLDADAAVSALRAQAAARGAQLRDGLAATAIRTSGGTAVELADGSVLPARCVVIAAGGWVESLAGGVITLPALRVVEQSVLHFPRREPAAAAWPSVIHEVGDAHAVYHLAGGRDGGAADDRKIGVHDAGPAVSAAARAAAGGAAVDPAVRAELVDYVREWLPGLEPTPRSETTCLYTLTPSEDFVLDRVDDVVVCSPCSGHGAKFAPLIGEFVADLVTGAAGKSGADAASVPERFRLAAHLSGTAGSVSL